MSSRNLHLTEAHQPIVDLQAEMLEDGRFQALCEKHGLPWNPAEGYEPRYYGGPAPAEVLVWNQCFLDVAAAWRDDPGSARRAGAVLQRDIFIWQEKAVFEALMLFFVLWMVLAAVVKLWQWFFEPLDRLGKQAEEDPFYR